MKLKQLVVYHWNVNRQGTLVALAALTFALIIDNLILLIPPPVSITRVLFNFHFGLAFLLIIFLGVIFSRKGIIWDTVSLALTLALFSIPLIYKWQTAGFYGYLLGGLLPWSDAQGYYSGAHQLIYEGHLTSWATRRPLFAGFLAVILSITDNNLQISLATLAVMNGLAVFLASREIQKIYGPFTAATFLAICYWYYCAHAGITASEQLGLCFGSLGAAFLIRGVQGESMGKVAYGLFQLTIALNARAGAFFILPVIVLWLGIHNKKVGWQKPIKVGIAVVAIAMIANLTMGKVVGSPNAVPFSNYSHTLYGLASGNAGWQQVTQDYPDVKEGEIFGLAIQKIRKDPSLFFIGILRSYRDYFTIERGQFSFLNTVNDYRELGSKLLWVLTWAGLAFALLKRKQGQYGLILATFVGILLSAGLVPPLDSDSMRIYAATIPITAYIASTGIAFFQQPLKKLGLSSGVSADGWSSSDLLSLFSATLLILCFAAPLFVKLSSQPQKTGLSLSCTPEKEEITFLMGRNSNIHLAEDTSLKESYIPSIQLTVFRNSAQTGADFYLLTEVLLNLDPNDTISIGTYHRTDTNSIQSGYLVTNGAVLKPGVYQICVTPAQDKNLKDVLFYYQPNKTEAEEQQTPIFHRDEGFVNEIRKLYGLGILLIYIFASLSYFDAWSASPIKKVFLFGGIVLIFAGITVFLHSNAFYFFDWERKSLDMKEAVYEGGYSYKLPLGIDWMDREALGESPAIVYEDNVPLKRPNSTQFSTNKLGKGRYSIQDGDLIISASDNSDPRTNGRRYELYWPVPISLTLQRVSYALAIISVFLLSLHLRKLNRGY
jgi:hypothetical protein